MAPPSTLQSHYRRRGLPASARRLVAAAAIISTVLAAIAAIAGRAAAAPAKSGTSSTATATTATGRWWSNKIKAAKAAAAAAAATATSTSLFVAKASSSSAAVNLAVGAKYAATTSTSVKTSTTNSRSSVPCVTSKSTSKASTSSTASKITATYGSTTTKSSSSSSTSTRVYGSSTKSSSVVYGTTSTTSSAVYGTSTKTSSSSLSSSAKATYGGSSTTATRTTVTDIGQCPTFAPRSPQPTSVHDLRVDEIQTIMGIGDSVMAGFGARVTSFLQLLSKNPLLEYRGANLATGGDDDSKSLGNSLLHYNPKLLGLSHGTRTFDFCYGPICPTVIEGDNVAVQGLNAAESGAWVSNWPTQYTYIQDHMAQVDSGYNSTFKFVPVVLGFNDLCLGCYNWTQDLLFDADKYESNVRDLLDALRGLVPRAVVLLLSPFDISQLVPIAYSETSCDIIRTVFWVECLCIDPISNDAVNSYARIAELAGKYSQRAVEIAQSYNAEKDPGFAVMVDPQFAALSMSGATPSILSAEDCFHPSKSAHDLLAINAWNNLFVPTSQKTAYDINQSTFVCPTADDRLYIDYGDDS
ncbi:hypothetical protein HK405_003171 [Cladochytrium tenue]|nr:hypothetical protein HK405_003171 [Cladochytrium tenue]